jgi:hypothetical protein
MVSYSALKASVVPTLRQAQGRLFRKGREEWGTLFVFCGRESQNQRQGQQAWAPAPHDSAYFHRVGMVVCHMYLKWEGLIL